MTSSADSLKKKVCVTVFLDELFEEVLDDNWRDFNQVSELTESDVKIPEKPFKGPLRIGLDNDEKVNVSPNADTERKEVQLRPRKHRRESKFSETPYDSFKNELTEYEYGSNFRTDDECYEPVESPVSDSDFDLDDFVETDKWTCGCSKSSFSELSEGNLSEECFASIRPVPSSLLLCCSKNEKHSEEMFHPPVRSTLTKNSIRSMESNSESEIKNGRTGDSFIKEGRNTGNDILAWKKTQTDIQLVLANAKSKQLDDETSRGDYAQHYDLRSILEACVKEGHTQSAPYAKDKYFYPEDEHLPSESPKAFHHVSESCSPELRDCVFPCKKRRNKNEVSEINRVCFKRNLWNDCLESELSEGDSPKGMGLRPVQNDSLLCYTLCLRCKRSVNQQTGRGETFEATHSSAYSTSRESSFESLKSKASQNADLILRTVTQLANQTILGTMLKNEQQRREEETKSEGNLLSEMRKTPPAIEGRNSSLAEGDTFQRPLHQDQRFLVEFKGKEKFNDGTEVVNHVEEPKLIDSSVMISRAQNILNNQNGDIVRTEEELLSRPSTPDGIAEFLFKQQQNGNLEKNMTDVESEMVFAESENSYEYDDFLDSNAPSVVLGTPNDICVVEFEDKLSRSKILRRMKTVEILGDNSINDLSSHISTEVFLICENISSNEVCLEAWHSSASTFKSFTEMGQCYLKDSKDSAMYLIEIPLHFMRCTNQEPSRSDQASDSE